YRVSFYAQLTAAGASCIASTIVTPNYIWTDPLTSSPETNLSAGSFSITNGSLGYSGVFGSGLQATATVPGGVTIRAKAGTVIQYSTTYAIRTSCSPDPKYVIYPILEQLTS